MNEPFGLQAKEKPLKGKFALVGGPGFRSWSKIIDQDASGACIKIKTTKRARPRWISVGDAIEIREKNGLPDKTAKRMEDVRP